MNFDYRFPLFEGLIQGNINPLSAQNATTADYPLRLLEQITDHAIDSGRFSLRFPKPVHPKQEYYLRLILNETYAYCTDLTAYLQSESDANIRAYLRDKILDKHLTTCLKRLGEHISALPLPVTILGNPTLCENQEDYYNAWVLHLLKACVAKAYLEVQYELADVVQDPLTEAGLYSAFLYELPPVKTFLVRRKGEPQQPVEKTYAAKPESQNVAAEPLPTFAEKTSQFADAFLLVEEVSEILRVNKRTVLRRIEAGEIKAKKDKGRWLIYKTAFNESLKK